MSTLMRIWHLIAIITITALGWWWLRQPSGGTGDQTVYPTRPIYIVVPYAAGGGSDTFVRIIQQGIEQQQLLPQPLVIINQAGGIGTIGSREVKNAEPDGYKILCHHNAIITAKLAGTVTYGPEAFEPIAMTGEMSMVILVRGDAPFQTLQDLLQAAKETPKSIRFGANKGAPAYFTALQLEKAVPGAEFSVVSSGGGADRYSKILGGHLEAGIFSLSEYLDFRGVEGTPPQQDIRAIVVLSEQRHDSIPDVPTAVELGLPVVLSNANYWWAPKGTPTEILRRLAATLQSAMSNQTVREELGRLRMDPTFDTGPSLETRLKRTVESFEAVATEKSASLPAFPLYVGTVVGLLFGWVIVDTLRRSNRPEGTIEADEVRNYRRRPLLAGICFLVLCVYVVVLGSGATPFAVTTAAMVLVMGGLMMRHAPARWPVLLELAVLTGLGSQFVFTEIFATLLP